MHISIYFGDKPLFLCDTIDEVVEPYIHHDDAVFIDELNLHTIKSMIHEMQLEKVHAGVFFHPDLAELKKEFFKKFKRQTAGGGLVLNENDEVLLIHRRGYWDMAKGKLDPGETIEQCAVREVTEETGLKDITLVAPLMITYHTYHQGTQFILKDSHWFTMKVKGSPELVPQKEEDIEEAIWVAKADLGKYMKTAYPSIREIIAKVK